MTKASVRPIVSKIQSNNHEVGEREIKKRVCIRENGVVRKFDNVGVCKANMCCER